MSRISPRARLAVVAVIAALALAISPATAAVAAGPGSATITLTGDSVPSFAFGQVSGPEGPSNAFFSGGTANLSDLALGDYTVTVGSSADNQGGSVSFTLTTENPSFVGELALVPWPTGTSSVSGTVVDADGVPISGASISVYDGNRPFPRVSTGPDGTYVVSNLVAGVYTLGAFEFSHFSRSVEFSVGDGDTTTVDVVLPVRDATISGRVVDGNGEPLGDISVVAERVGPERDFGSGFASPDGTYVVTGVGAGDWVLSAGGPGTPYGRTDVPVTLTAGDNPVADLVLTPRTTATIFAFVVDESPTPLPNYPFGICATLLTPGGVEVAVFDGTGGDGAIAFSDQPPGTYTVKIYDCDPTRVPGYATQYYGGSATLAGATTFTVTAGQDLTLDTFSLTVASGPTKPTHTAHAVPTHDLKQANRGDIDAPDKARQGARITIQIGIEYAGDWVSVWLHDPKDRLGGWRQVAADGTVKVRVPADYPTGQHKLAVQDRDDDLIGWTKINVKH